MAPTPPRQTTAQTQSTQDSTQSTVPAPTQNPPQRRPGRARGSQGYSHNDCAALVDAVKELDPLKLKFCALVNSTKPTGDPNIPPHVRAAKENQLAMDKQAHVLALNDKESNGEENGVGAPIPMSLDDSTQDTQNRNELAKDDEVAKDDNTEAIDEDEGPHPAPLPFLPGMGTRPQDVQSPSPSEKSLFSAFARTSQVGPHQSDSMSRASTCTPMNGPTQASQQSGLQEANKTIKNLCIENNRLHSEIAQMRVSDMTKMHDLQTKMSDLRFKNQSLKCKMDLMQLKMNMSSASGLGANNLGRQMHSQPPFGIEPML
ncbi:hypothetical protein PCASD_14623 [Puccinia coronata f. sp. avenae]|uniref:DUF6818 domain-containing protein n=1 Tax=Puccinia coronata f. sp. avenae TaxID=200324 RepID=A0A2N5TUM8_9BASI|nr:hypothetical protein PCASD_14623 [Puccinia coronata f. sp. avenae]